MSPRVPFPRSRSSHKGFALVVTLLIMAFVLVVVFSLATLMIINTATTRQSLEMTQARQNALLGMQLAVGQLQKLAGPDQRITASADLFAPNPGVNHPHWVGVWDTSATSALQSAQNAADKLDAVTGWLVSVDESLASNPQSIATNLLELVPVAGSSPAVEAPLLRVPKQTNDSLPGRYAYWVADESLKARLNLVDPYVEATEQDGLRRYQTIPTVDVTAIDEWETFPRFGNALKNLLTWESIRFVMPSSDADPYRHDFTLWSRGVLTDVAHGGLKADLTHAFENNQVFEREFSGANFQLLDDPAIVSGGPNWGNLRAFYRLPEAFEADGHTIAAIGPGSAAAPFTTNVSDFPANFRQADSDLPYVDSGIRSSIYHQNHPVLPVFGRFILGMLISYESNAAMPGSWKPRLHISPHFVLYNPTTAVLDMSGMDLAISYQAAIQPTIQVIPADGSAKSSVTAGLHEISQNFSGAGGRTNLRFFVPGSAGLSFQPGEMRIFSLARDFDQNESEALGYEMVPDFLPGNAITVGIAPAHAATVRGPTNSGSPSDARYGLTADEWNDLLATDMNDLIEARFNWKHGQPSIFALMWEAQNYEAATQKMENPLALFNPAAWGSGDTLSRTLSSLSSSPESFGFWDVGLAHSQESNEPGRHLVDGNPRFMEAFSDWEGATRANHPSEPNSGPRSLASIGVSGSGGYRGWTADLADSDFAPNITNFERATTTWGSGDSGAAGFSHIPLFDIPREKPLSLGSFQHAHLSRYAHDPAFPMGNSYASIRIPRAQTKVENFAGQAGLTHFDLSHHLNTKMWDSYFLSGIDPSLSQSDIENIFRGGVTDTFPSPRLRLFGESGNLIEPGMLTDPDEELTFQTVAGHLFNEGAFNIHSTSVEAWTALLASVLDIPIPGNNPESPGSLNFITNSSGYTGMSRTWGEGYDTEAPGGDENFFRGFRAMDSAMLRSLANNIVNEVKARGPFPSLAAFINRSLVDAADDADGHGLRGALQAALDKPGGPNAAATINGNLTGPAPTLPGGSWFVNNLSGPQSAGFPGYVLQSDLLELLGPVLTARGDTFLIRAYGDTLHPRTGRVVSKAWAEAIVQRTPKPAVLSDDPDSRADLANPSSPFGRAFRIVSFRWLNEDEI